MVLVIPSSPQEFQDAFNNSSKVVIYFTAEWCGPCRAMAPVVEKLASQNPDILILKVDIDRLKDLDMVQSISSVPTFVSYKDKTKILEFSGGNPSALEKMVSQLK